MAKKFVHGKSEKKWQGRWEEKGLYTPDIKGKNKFYNLWMFPYPSAEGLHMGAAFASTGSDIYGRYMRMNGKNVFQPFGYDSFGIHSENFALKIGDHPKAMIDRTTKNFERQMRSLGHGYDWTRTVTTSDIGYYKWTQWLFVELFKAGLAYRKAARVNWCPSCKTVLSDEQVLKGQHEGKPVQVCERCGTKVERRELEQWFFRITNYADRLLGNLGKIDWSERVVTAQRNWIGKKEGINITYPVDGAKQEITAWTSRPDTNFGATFIVLAPEHPLAEKLATKKYKKKVSEYIKKSQDKLDDERAEEGRKKTGVFTGAHALNRLNGERLPVWVSDFVLSGVGTGAVVGVPGHDRRDFEFAKEFDIPVKRVVTGPDGDDSDIVSIGQVWEEGGITINSMFLDGMSTPEAIDKIMNYLEKKGWGKRETGYHLRDWLISRQRYWGPPIPMIYCEKCARGGKSWFTQHKAQVYTDQTDWEHAGWYPEEDLPVALSYLENYQPKGTGRGPLADHPEFYEVKCPHCGADAKRETDVSDTFLDSSWYFLRYPSAHSNFGDSFPWDLDITKKWLPVDLYFGGAEHSVLHLMYARFIWMVLFDLERLDRSLGDEPFPRFFAHGLMIKDGAKMSKSKGNVINPDEYVDKYGADTVRLYNMFLGPMDGTPDFRDSGIEGMRRFVDRVWDVLNIFDIDINKESERKVVVKMHWTIKRVTEDIEAFRYNTAISAVMEYVNLLREVSQNSLGSTNRPPASASRARGSASSEPGFAWGDALTVLAQLIAPFAPHLAEEAWVEVLGNEFSVHTSKWPEYDKELTKSETVTIAVQVNGKLRGSVEVSAEESKDQGKVEKHARSEENVKKYLEGEIERVIFVPGKIINFVA